jgi:hypothetical protein
MLSGYGGASCRTHGCKLQDVGPRPKGAGQIAEREREGEGEGKGEGEGEGKGEGEGEGEGEKAEGKADHGCGRMTTL